MNSSQTDPCSICEEPVYYDNFMYCDDCDYEFCMTCYSMHECDENE